MSPSSSQWSGRGAAPAASAVRRDAVLMVVLGVATVAYFAIAGGVPRDRMPSLGQTIVAGLPAIVVITLTIIRFNAAGDLDDRTRRLEGAIGAAFVVLLFVGICLDIFLLGQGSLAAMLTGVPAALALFYGAWRITRT